jgi:hypothetical protein
MAAVIAVQVQRRCRSPIQVPRCPQLQLQLQQQMSMLVLVLVLREAIPR